MRWPSAPNHFHSQGSTNHSLTLDCLRRNHQNKVQIENYEGEKMFSRRTFQGAISHLHFPHIFAHFVDSCNMSAVNASASSLGFDSHKEKRHFPKSSLVPENSRDDSLIT